MFPVNFFLGGAVGALATYVYKDEKAKQWVIEKGHNLKEGTSAFFSSFKKKDAPAEPEASATTPPVEGTVVSEHQPQPQ